MGGGYAYVVGPGGLGDPVKIGWSVKPEERVKQLQTGSPCLLRLLSQHSGPEELERFLHREFASLRTHGEWFDFRGEDPLPLVAEAASRFHPLPRQEICVNADIQRDLWRYNLNELARTILDHLVVAHDELGFVRATQADLGGRYGYSHSAVSRALAPLVRLGLVRPVKNGTYWLHPVYAYRHGEQKRAALIGYFDGHLPELKMTD